MACRPVPVLARISVPLGVHAEETPSRTHSNGLGTAAAPMYKPASTAAATGRAGPLPPVLALSLAEPHLICGSLQFCRSIVSSRRSARCAQRTVGERTVAISAADQVASGTGNGAAQLDCQRSNVSVFLACREGGTLEALMVPHVTAIRRSQSWKAAGSNLLCIAGRNAVWSSRAASSAPPFTASTGAHSCRRHLLLRALTAQICHHGAHGKSMHMQCSLTPPCRTCRCRHCCLQCSATTCSVTVQAALQTSLAPCKQPPTCTPVLPVQPWFYCNDCGDSIKKPKVAAHCHQVPE